MAVGLVLSGALLATACTGGGSPDDPDDAALAGATLVGGGGTVAPEALVDGTDAGSPTWT